jgi:hypothetical protein
VAEPTNEATFTIPTLKGKEECLDVVVVKARNASCETSANMAPRDFGALTRQRRKTFELRAG